MTKTKLLAAHCEQSPTGAHHYVMEWPEPGVYQGVCRYCGHVKAEDARLGEVRLNKLPDGTTFYRGKRSEFRLARSKGVQE